MALPTVQGEIHSIQFAENTSKLTERQGRSHNLCFVAPPNQSPNAQLDEEFQAGEIDCNPAYRFQVLVEWLSRCHVSRRETTGSQNQVATQDSREPRSPAIARLQMGLKDIILSVNPSRSRRAYSFAPTPIFLVPHPSNWPEPPSLIPATGFSAYLHMKDHGSNDSKEKEKVRNHQARIPHFGNFR